MQRSESLCNKNNGCHGWWVAIRTLGRSLALVKAAFTVLHHMALRNLMCKHIFKLKISHLPSVLTLVISWLTLMLSFWFDISIASRRSDGNVLSGRMTEHWHTSCSFTVPVLFICAGKWKGVSQKHLPKQIVFFFQSQGVSSTVYYEDHQPIWPRVIIKVIILCS